MEGPSLLLHWEPQAGLSQGLQGHINCTLLLHPTTSRNAVLDAVTPIPFMVDSGCVQTHATVRAGRDPITIGDIWQSLIPAGVIDAAGVYADLKEWIFQTPIDSPSVDLAPTCGRFNFAGRLGVTSTNPRAGLRVVGEVAERFEVSKP